MMFLARRLNSGIPYHASPSGGNCEGTVNSELARVWYSSVCAHHVDDEDLWGNWAVVTTFFNCLSKFQWFGSTNAYYGYPCQKRAGSDRKAHFYSITQGH